MKLSELCHHFFCAIGLLTVFTTSRLCDVEELNVTSASYGMTDQILLEITKHLLKLKTKQDIFKIKKCLGIVKVSPIIFNP